MPTTTGKVREVSLSQGFSDIQQVSDAMNPTEADAAIPRNADVLVKLGEKIERSKQNTAMPHTMSTSQVAASQTVPLPAGLEFLTTPPSPPTKTVKLQLSGPMKFVTSMACHTFAVNDQLVVLVVDNRIKAEIIDLSLEDQSIEAELILDGGERISVYPPVPAVMTYDIGVLRHFVFIRKYAEDGDTE